MTKKSTTYSTLWKQFSFLQWFEVSFVWYMLHTSICVFKSFYTQFIRYRTLAVDFFVWLVSHTSAADAHLLHSFWYNVRILHFCVLLWNAMGDCVMSETAFLDGLGHVTQFHSVVTILTSELHQNSTFHIWKRKWSFVVHKVFNLFQGLFRWLNVNCNIRYMYVSF